MAVEKIKILGAVLDLPANQHSQSSPNPLKYHTTRCDTIFVQIYIWTHPQVSQECQKIAFFTNKTVEFLL